MTRHLVRAATLLLLLALAGASFALQEARLLLAAAAIGALVETGLALRARRRTAPAGSDPSRFEADRVACTADAQTLRVALTGQEQAGRAAPQVVLSRTLATPAAGGGAAHGPLLELSGRTQAVHGGIHDAYLCPRLLRLTLDARGAEALGTQEVCVTLPAGLDQRQLERALRGILRGVAFLSERSMPEEAPDSLPGVLP